MTDYTLIKSKRKTLSVEVRDGRVIVRVPNRTSKRAADEFVRKHEDWIERQLKKSRLQAEQTAAVEKLTQSELDALHLRAREYLPRRAQHYAAMLGAEFNRVTIRCQKTRWGSCSAKKNLNFNCLLMLAPAEVIDSVVAHEVCHLKEMNHGARFYALVREIFPDYDRCNRWLKDNGKLLMARIPDNP